MDRNDGSDSGFGFFSGLIIGGMVGALVAIVLAPASGEETRDYLRGKAHEAKHRALDLAYDVKDRAAEVAGDLRQQADQLTRMSRQAYESTKAKINDAVDAGRRAAQSKIDDLESEQ
jgi:gas vesicle protein